MSENRFQIIVKNNENILDGFFNSDKLLLTKYDLLEKGFDFSQFYITNTLNNYFDNNETSFDYFDFTCGNYYVKIKWVNEKVNNEFVRCFFQLIKVDFKNELLAKIKQSEALIRKRKLASGTWWAYNFDNVIGDDGGEIAKMNKAEYEKNEIEINYFIPKLQAEIKSLDETKKQLEVLLQLMEQKKSIEDRAVE